MNKICDRNDCIFYKEQEKYLDKCINCQEHICSKCFSENCENCIVREILIDYFEAK